MIGPNEEDMRDALWLARVTRALARRPMDPPENEGPPERPKAVLYCTICDSSYCTCKKEKQ